MRTSFLCALLAMVCWTASAGNPALERELARLCAGLGDRRYRQREAATASLERLAWDHAATARHWIGRRLQQEPSLEVRRRLLQVLDALARGRWLRLPRSPVPGLGGRVSSTQVLHHGKLLLWGGFPAATRQGKAGDALASGAVLDLARRRWMPLPRAPLAPRARALGLVHQNKLLIWGGLSSGGAPLSDAAAYDLARGRWVSWRRTPGGPLDQARAVFTGAELVVCGQPPGWRSSTPERLRWAALDVARGRWRRIEAAPLSPRWGGTLLWTGRQVIYWGGRSIPGDRALADGAAYDPSRRRWTAIPQGSVKLARVTWVQWDGLRLTLIGGSWNDGRPAGTSFQPSTGAWRTISPPPFAWPGACVALGRRKVLMLGYHMQRGLQVAVYHVAANRWDRLEQASRTIPQALQRRIAAAGRTSDGRLLFVTTTGFIGLLDPATQRWLPVAQPPFAVDFPIVSAQVLDRGLLLGARDSDETWLLELPPEPTRPAVPPE